MITGLFQNVVSVFGQVGVLEATSVVDPVTQNASSLFSDPCDAYLGVFAKKDDGFTGGGGKRLDVVERFIQRLGDEDPDVRFAAAEALGKIGDTRAVEPLIQRLGDEDPEVLSAAADALGDFGDPRVVEPLIRRLGDEDPEVRFVAASALGYIGDPRAVEPLIQTLGDEHPDVRAEADWALNAICESSFQKILGEFFAAKTRKP